MAQANLSYTVEEIDEILRKAEEIDLKDFIKKTDCASNKDILDRNDTKYLTPASTDFLVIDGLTRNKVALSEQEKQAALEFLGAKKYVDGLFGAYITDIANLVGGDA